MAIRACLVLLAATVGQGWVFTDVKYNPQWRSLGNGAYRSWTDLDNEIGYEENELTHVDMQKLSLIFPGTRWCGAGDIADSYEDLGPARETDKCCREHDHCEDTIPSGHTRHNLTNEAFYTRLSCECDETFYKCLKTINSKTSNTVGVLYFDAIDTSCFRDDYPKTGCKRRGGFLNRKCIEYSYDTSREKRYQWFDVPIY